MLQTFPGRLVRQRFAREVVGPAYDQLDGASRAAHARAHPRAFFRVTRSPSDDPTLSTDELARASRGVLEDLLDDGVFDEPVDGLMLYELGIDGHRQIGIVAALPLAAAADGRVLRHELTRPDRVDVLALNQQIVGAWSSPVALTYRADPPTDEVVAALSARPADIELVGHYAVDQRIWRIDDPAEITALRSAFRRRVTYIIDGHHRLDAAVHRDDPVDPLVVLFPHDQLRLRGFHRVVSDVEATAVLDRAVPIGAGEDPRPAGPGQVGVWAAGRWHRLELPAASGRRLVDQLDVSRLQDGIIGPLLGVTDPRTDPRLHHLPDSAGLDGVRTRAGENGIGFVLAAISVDDLLAVSDAGDTMPPKSTSFEPKARSGLILRLDED
ncbi:MAG: DUF1015 family protein [Actinomycetota bacterium]